MSKMTLEEWEEKNLGASIMPCGLGLYRLVNARNIDGLKNLSDFSFEATFGPNPGTVLLRRRDRAHDEDALRETQIALLDLWCWCQRLMKLPMEPDDGAEFLESMQAARKLIPRIIRRLRA